MLDKIFEDNDGTLYEVQILEEGVLEFALDDSGNKIKICKLSDVEFNSVKLFKPIDKEDKQDYIAKQRMGFTYKPGERYDGDAKWLTIDDLTNIKGISINKFDTKTKLSQEEVVKKYPVSPNTTIISKSLPIQYNDILVSFKMTIGIVKIYRFTDITYCNEAIDIITVNNNGTSKPLYSIDYISLFIGREYLKYTQENVGSETLNNDLKDKIYLKIPNNHLEYSSYKIQQSITKYITEKIKLIEDREDTIDIMLSLLQAEKDKITDEIFTNGSQKIKIGDFLIKNTTKVLLNDDTLYTRVTVRMKNLGTKVRDTDYGINIGTKEQFLIEEGQFILSKIDARNAAFGMVTEEIDGAIVTNDFPTFNIDRSKISLDFLLLFTSSTEFLRICERSSKGVTGRKRVKEDILMDIEIALPDITQQDEIMENLKDQFKSINSKKDSLLIMKELLEIGREKILNGVF